MVEISVDDAKRLMEIYRKDWPKFINGYHALDTFVRWRNKGANIKVLSLNGKWEEDGTFIITVRLDHLVDDSLITLQFQNDRFFVFPSTLQDSCENLKIALSLMDLKEFTTIGSFEERLRPAILEVVRSKNFKDVPEKTVLHYKPKEEILKMEKP